MERNLNDQELVRRNKADELRKKGIDPYGQSFLRTHKSLELHNLYDKNTKQELEEKEIIVSVAGRIMMKRRMGKIGFITLQDRDGRIQIVVNKQVVKEEVYEIFKSSDLGDIIGIEGVVMKTNTDELSLRALKYTHLTKALRPLPEKFHGLSDIEERYRRRYLDLITNDKAKEIAILRPKIIRTIQNFLDNEGLIEVETPILQPILGGASARPFVTHHNTLDIDLYLRIATELPLKRLIVGGLEGVYEIGRLFRNEGMDSSHNPEFTTAEIYIAYSDMYGMMELCENLFRYVAKTAIGKTNFVFKGEEISLDAPFKKIHMVEAIKDVTGIDFFKEISIDEALKLAKNNNIKVENHQKSIGHIINLFFETFVEETLIQPTFIYGHPIEISPLAKKSVDTRFTERFELFIDKTEYANAFSELNDPIDQKERFENQLKQKALGDVEASEMDNDYVEALEYGMPPTGGIGIGIDRLIMFLTGNESIREVLLFPTMKHRATND